LVLLKGQMMSRGPFSTQHLGYCRGIVAQNYRN